MNDNDQNINLTWNINIDMVHFLDLEIRNTQRGIETRTYFKATDRNSYIPTMSCHFRPWMDNIPRGQYMRIKKNCTQKADFELQSQLLTNMFKQKGNRDDFLEKEK